MNFEQIIMLMLVVAIVVVLLIVLRQVAHLQDSFERKLSEENYRTQRRVDALAEQLDRKIDQNNTHVRESITHQLGESGRQMRDSRQAIAEISARLATITETNRRVENVASELKTLQAVLQNPKQRGVFGEYYLDSVLGNILPPGTYQTQYKFKDGEIVDAAVFLDKGKILPVDSKFSLENYNRMVAADTKAERELYAKKVRDDLKGRIDETAKYIRPSEHTMDFAFMFVPSESLYYDLLINKVGTSSSERDLIEYAYRDKKVIITSPTSFMAYLQTILQGLRSLQIEKDTKEIQERVAKLGVHLENFGVYLDKLGNSLGTTVGHYNSAYKTFAQIDKDVVKIEGDKRQTIEVKIIDRPAQD